MSEDLIRRSDAIEALYKYDFVSKDVIEREINAIPTIEPKAKVVAQVTFDEEKLREIVKEAVERFKEEYEIADRPQGEWIMSGIQNEADVLNGNYAYVCTNCNHTDIHVKTQKVPYCWWCGARMKGADDE